MTKRRLVKTIHLVGTLWFGGCATYLLVVALRRAGVNWWAIFSLSGPSLAAAFVLVSLYLYAVYRGATQSVENVVEHPLTSSAAYMVFYYSCPFLGAVGAILGTVGESQWQECVVGTTLGTVGATFVVWVVLDPMLGLVESVLPGSREHRQRRLAQAKARRQQEQAARESLLRQLEEEERSLRMSQQEALRPMVGELVAMLPRDMFERPEGEGQAVDLGLRAWKLGGLEAMVQLHEMVVEQFCKENGREPDVDTVGLWWDGVGTWKAPAYLQEGRMDDV